MFEKMKMKSPDIVSENMAYIARRWPECLTEAKDENGKLRPVIDFDKLRQLLSSDATGEGQERYQFTWPDKRHAIRLANTPTTHTLRPLREDSVDFDNTQNLYIEGDNLDVLKLLRESYLGKVKMIYIDPPYNTGGDFVYKDNFIKRNSDYAEISGAYDEEGNQIVEEFEKNTDSNGRFHTDWLNMIYPRLKVARDLLAEDGVIFISIDDNEQKNLKNVCDEVFGGNNFVAIIPWRKRTAKSDVPFGVSQDYEWIIVYAKSNLFNASVEGKERKYYTTPDFPNRPWRVHDLTKQTTASERPNSFFTIVNPKTGEEYPANPNSTWRITEETFQEYYQQDRMVFPGDYDFLKISKPVLRYWKEDDMKKAGAAFGRVAVSTKLPDEIGMSQDGTKEVTDVFKSKIFSFPKPSSLVKYFLQIINDNSAIILDFFSGSATTAHAVMRQNAEDGGHRKYICVQLPEATPEGSEAYKAGYKTICEIGKERIRRAGKKILEEQKTKNPEMFTNVNGGGYNAPLDIGFRVLKLDSSNMENVYYTPAETTELTLFADNIKPDRTDEDLLFQVMMELGIALSDKIEKTVTAGKTVWNVGQGYLMACFERDVTEDTITAIAKQQPQYFVMADRSLASDNVADNFEQIFNEYSDSTIRKII
jgi:adenine-specific DNA-methyltransferase